MQFQSKLQVAQLVKRYKRFLADVIDPQQGLMTIYCPNTGSMKNCWGLGWKVWLLDSENSKRKYRYTWMLSENEQGDLIGINSSFANDIVHEAIVEGRVAELSEFSHIEREVKYGDENSRIDILLTHSSGDANLAINTNQKTFIEVKSVTLLDELQGSSDNKHLQKGQGFFPDAVTSRGQKHIRELINCVKQGHRAVLFFLVQHTGIKQVAIAQHIDPKYAQLVKSAIENGVEILVYNTQISPVEIRLKQRITFKSP